MSDDNYELFELSDLSADLLTHLDDIGDEARKKWPRDLVALIDIYQAALQRLGHDTADARRIAHTLISELAIYCGGRYIYLPKGDALEKAIRDVRLFVDWSENHKTPEQLVEVYSVSLQHVYRIIKEQRQYRINKVQPKLL